MLNSEEKKQLVEMVLAAVQGVKTDAALSVLAAAMVELADGVSVDSKRSTEDELIARRSRLKVEKDPEVRDLVHSLSHLSVDQITKECKARFGARAPGRTAIYSYINRLARRKGLGR